MVKRTVLLLVSSISNTCEQRTVSIVGTMISENFISGVMVYSGSPYIQFSHRT